MTEELKKMPVVGERYRNKLNSKDYFLASINTIFRECSNQILGFEFFLKIPSEEVNKVREAQNPYFRTSMVYDRLDYFWTDFEPIPQGPISQPSIPEKNCGYCGGTGGTMLLSKPPKWQPCSKCSPGKEERLPEAGREYRRKNLPDGYDVFAFEVHFIEKRKGDIEFMIQLITCAGNWLPRCSLEEFWKDYEEIPNNSQGYSEEQNQIKKMLDLSISYGESINIKSKTGDYHAINFTDPNCSFDRWLYNLGNGRFKVVTSPFLNNSQELSEVQVKESILSDEIREAMEKLKRHLYLYGHSENYSGLDCRVTELLDKSKNLLSALESMDK